MSASPVPQGDSLFTRHPKNPVLTARQWPYTVNSVFNPGAAVDGDDTVLVCRVEDRRGISHLGVARSADGFTGWRVQPEPLMTSQGPLDEWGLEDARVTRVDELGCWVIAYTAFAPGGPAVNLARTQDFRTVERLGMAMQPEDKNAALFPRTINGEFLLLHRPVSRIASRADVWLSRSRDLKSWTAAEPVLRAREGGWWDSARVGCGPPPLETPDGWLMLYHGVRHTVAGSIYRVGLALLDLEQPSRVVRRSDGWVLGPREVYETTGDVPNVVFPTGLVYVAESDELRLYYGAADTCVAAATARLAEVRAHLRAGPSA